MMKRYASFKILLCVVCLIFLVQIVAAERDISGIWQLRAPGTSTGCTINTPSVLGPCGSFVMGDPDIHVTQSGTTLTASEVDNNGNPFTLNGVINGNTVTFTIQGIGITPGFAPATTTYTGTLNKNVITGSFSGSATSTFYDGNGNSFTETYTWTNTDTFKAKINQGKVDVRVNKLPGMLKNFYHSYIIYTDSSGKEWYYRGGAQYPNTPPFWGKLVTEFGPYTEGTVDWNKNARSLTVLSGEDALNKNICFSNEINRIASLQYDYNPVWPNCNTVAYTLLTNCGITPDNPIKNMVQIPGWGQTV